MVVLEVSRVLTAAIHLAGTGRPEAVHAAVMSPAEVAAGRSPWGRLAATRCSGIWYHLPVIMT